MPPPAQQPVGPPADTFTLAGTVVWQTLEGGFFAIHTDDGKKYDPINLPEAMKQDGLRISVQARLKEGAVSFHMYGPIIEIVDTTSAEASDR